MTAAVRRRGVAESLAYPRPMTVVERLPGFIAPMLLTSTPELPANDGWSLEVKWDGMRAQLRCDGRRVSLRSRPGRDCTAEFPELRSLADLLDVPVLLDGELVCLDREAYRTSSSFGGVCAPARPRRSARRAPRRRRR